MHILVERVTKVEVQLQEIKSQEARRYEGDKEREKKLDKVLEELGRYKGFVGGVLFIVGALWAFIKTGLPFLAKLAGKEI